MGKKRSSGFKQGTNTIVGLVGLKEGEKRRDKRKCLHYRETNQKQCGFQSGGCIDVSHCQDYTEDKSPENVEKYYPGDDLIAKAKAKQEARGLFERALKEAQHHNINYMYHVARYYEVGFGVVKDYIQARKWYTASFDHGKMHGAVAVGRLYENGLGTKKDLKKALAWYEKGAAVDEPGAQERAEKVRNLLLSKVSTRVRTPAILLAQKMINESKIQDGAESLKEAATPKENIDVPMTAISTSIPISSESGNQEGEEIKEEPVTLIETPIAPPPKEMQAEEVHSTDPWVLGNEAYHQEQWHEAYRYFKRAARKGKAKVFRKLADMYYEGIGLPEADYRKAFQYYKLAAAKNGSYAMYRLGMMYLRGEYVESSKLDALAWFGCAVEGGYKKAQEDYERVRDELQLDDILPTEKLFLSKM